MALFNTVCALAHLIGQSDRFTSANEALTHPNTFGMGGAAEDYLEANFVQIARQQRLHFSGYLLVHCELDTVNSDPNVPPQFKLHPLSDNAWLETSICDRFMRKLNKAIVDSLPKPLNSFAQGIDPYMRFAHPQYHSESSLDDAYPKECDEIVLQLASEFSSNPSVAGLLERVSRLGTHSKENFPHELLLNLDKELTKDGLRLDDYQRIRGLAPGMSPESANLLQISTLMCCLLNSIRSIDSLIYDAHRMKAIPSLDDSNIYGVDNLSATIICQVLRVKVQPQGPEMFSEPGSVVRVCLEKLQQGISPPGPALVWKTVFNYSRDLGTSMTFDLRPLDQWLNPFGGLATGLV